MQPGEIIQGKQGRYELIRALGNPGLYGQAFLCREFADGSEYVVKALQPGAPSDGSEVLEREARNLERVAASEDAVGRKYAVRLIDRSLDNDSRRGFIVMERATGKNVLTEIVERIQDWDTLGLDGEEEALLIAKKFADALACVHRAGLLYDDMKLDNLFWERPTLRIIDWNVLGEIRERGANGIAGDWARFGARLCELCTGQRIGLDRDGTLIGSGPQGPHWERLPDGIRDIIRFALKLGYQDDARIAADIERELAWLALEREGKWTELLQRAEIAAGDNSSQPIQILAPLARAERLIRALPEHLRTDAEPRCDQVRQDAGIRQGQVAHSEMSNAFRLLRSGNFSLAINRFQEAYRQVGERDPRPRRGLWLAQLATDYPDRYAVTRDDLEKIIELLNDPDSSVESLRSAKLRLNLAELSWRDIDLFRWLSIEVDMLMYEHDGRLDLARECADSLHRERVTGRFRDLQEKRSELTVRLDNEQRRAHAEKQRQESRAKRNAYLVRAYAAEATNQIAIALKAYQDAAKLPDTDEAFEPWLHYHISALGRQLELQRLADQAAGIDRSSGESSTQIDSLVRRAKSVIPDLEPLFNLLIYQYSGSQLEKLEMLQQQTREQLASLPIVLEEQRKEHFKFVQTALAQQQTAQPNEEIQQSLERITGQLLQRLEANAESIRTALAQQQTAQPNEEIQQSLEQITGQLARLQPQEAGGSTIVHVPLPSTEAAELSWVRELIGQGLLQQAEKQLREIEAKVGESTAISYLKEGIRIRHEQAESNANEIATALHEKDFVRTAKLIDALLELEADNEKYQQQIEIAFAKIRAEWDEFDRSWSLPLGKSFWREVKNILGESKHIFFSIILDRPLRRLLSISIPSAQHKKLRKMAEDLALYLKIAQYAHSLGSNLSPAEFDSSLSKLSLELGKNPSLLPRFYTLLQKIPHKK